MDTQTIQRQYDEVVAPHYDLDPLSVTNRSLDRAVAQIRKELAFGESPARLKVYDVGAGTGLFLMKLLALSGEHIQPFALDLSARMLANAQRKMPGLAVAVDDGANLDAHFQDELFDLIATHFITGFIPMPVLAAKIWNRLDEGGYWSLMGATREAYPALQARASSKVLRWLLGAGPLVIEDHATIPAGREEVVRTLESHGFEVCAVETFRPILAFANFDDFMDFAYRGGWLTPFIEGLGLHQAGAFTRRLMNWFFFPISDHHTIEIALARKSRK